MVEQTLTFEQYLAGLPPERRSEVERVWRAVRENIPAGYAERIGDKFLTFAADDEQLVALASQKNYISLYLMPLYVFPELKAKFDAAAGTKLKCGKSCINFSRAEDLPLLTIAEILTACPDVKVYKAHLLQMRAEAQRKRKPG